MSLKAVGTAAVETEKLVSSIDTLKSYKYGNTGGVDLRWVEKQVGMASKDSDIRGQIEQKLIEALTVAKTNDAKQFLCRQLRTIGTVKAVPQLESMLTDPEISHMARYALGRIDAPEAGVALHRALKKTSGKIKAGIINTLVKANYGRALGDFMKLIGNSDKDVAIAAIRATGHFPCNSSVIALRRARRSADKDIQVEINAALLTSAEIFLAKGDKKRSAAIYEDFYSGKYPGHLRAAGLRGLVAARSEGAAGLLEEAIKGDDANPFEGVEPVSLFDGETFNGWEGNLEVFRIEDGAVVAGSLDGPVVRNEYLCSVKDYADFELRLKVKLLGSPETANAGIQIRSRRVAGSNEMVGYQADMGQHYWGSLYCERRHKVIAAANRPELDKVLKLEGWNDYRILCHGRRIRLWINGYQTVDYAELDESIEQTGVIGLQIHGGPAAQSRYRNIIIRVLK
jgi:hypothetical protein